MKNFRTLLIIGLVIGGLVAIKIFLLGGGTASQPKMGGGPGKDAPVLVKIFVVKPDTLNNDLFLSGTLTANESVELKPEIAGRIVKIKFTEGTRVAAGDLLVKINDADLQAQLKKVKLQEKLISEQLERRKKLLTINGISQEEYDAAANQLASYQADIALINTQIEKTEIRAPFSGMIGLKNISEGAFIAAGTTIATLVQHDPIKIDFSVPEKYASLIKQNSTVLFSLDGDDKQLSATIKAIEPQIDEASRTIKVRTIAQNRSGALLPGAFAQIKLPLASSKNAVMIPTEAIIPILKGQKVYLVKNGIAEESKVETGLRNDVKIQILKGVSIGDTLVVSGLLQVKKGSKVKWK